MTLRLVIFDVDGTLVDSQADIVAAMRASFDAVGRTAPSRAEVLSIVGLSLDLAIARLAPDAAPATLATMVNAYKETYIARQTPGVAAPLFPGVLDVLAELETRDGWLLGIATGKSRRGLTALLQAHGLERTFITEQVADYHPSKPHPAMLQAAVGEAGVTVSDAVMVGDTTFDMDMAQAAGVFGVGVSWGYHPREELTAAGVILDDIAELPALLDDRWRQGA